MELGIFIQKEGRVQNKKAFYSNKKKMLSFFIYPAMASGFVILSKSMGTDTRLLLRRGVGEVRGTRGRLTEHMVLRCGA